MPRWLYQFSFWFRKIPRRATGSCPYHAGAAASIDASLESAGLRAHAHRSHGSLWALPDHRSLLGIHSQWGFIGARRPEMSAVKAPVGDVLKPWQSPGPLHPQNFWSTRPPNHTRLINGYDQWGSYKYNRKSTLDNINHCLWVQHCSFLIESLQGNPNCLLQSSKPAE